MTNIIIINGLPGTGKTTLSEAVSEQLGLPLLSKDAIKELLFDSLGAKDRAWSKKLGQATFPILFAQVDELVKAGVSHIIESPLNPQFEDARFQRYEKEFGVRVIQVLLTCDGEVLFERFKKRAKSARHEGHNDTDPEVLEEMRPALMKGRLEPLNTNGPLIEIDTTDFATVDTEAIVDKIRLLLQSESTETGRERNSLK